MSNQPLLSLCIPTNGVLDWVRPVLESIYCQHVDESNFEVIVTDNGNSIEFQQYMGKQIILHDNLHYRKTTSQGFLNQIECFRDANGIFIKFVNHRMMLKMGVIAKLLDFVRTNQKEKTITFFLNGSLHLPEENNYDSFDEFLSALSYYSSWSGGLGLWKEDFEKIPSNITYNKLFPHTTILFWPFEYRKYCIDNCSMMISLPENHPKGKYNLFNAFAVEYPSILCDLYRQNRITITTFLKIKKDLLFFLASLYLDYFILRRKCSYDLEGTKQYINVYYSLSSLYKKLFEVFLHRVKHKLFNSIVPHQ